MPVIIVADNDTGLDAVRGAMKKYKVVLDPTLPFQRICHNLYLVCVPGAGNSIESLYPATVLATKLSGKTFNISNKPAAGTEYGKTYFSEYVVLPNKSKIDFSGFSGLINGIEAAIQDYKMIAK